MCPVLSQGAYRVAVGSIVDSELWALLWSAAISTEHRARLCAVEWACELFDFSNVAARRLCISLCDDKVTAVRSAASRGLRPMPRTSCAPSEGFIDAIGGSYGYPTFAAFVLGALRDDTAPAMVRGGGAAPVSCKDLALAALARALDFALECRRAHPPGVGGALGGAAVAIKDEENESEEEAVAVFMSLVEYTLKSAPSAADGQHGHAQMVLLHRSAAVALQKMTVGDSLGVVNSGAEAAAGAGANASPGTSMLPAAGVAENLASRGSWLQQWLGHEASTEIREAFAEITGAAAVFMNPNTELVPLLRALGLKLKVTGCQSHGGGWGAGGDHRATFFFSSFFVFCY